jgi:hypothetical protein
MNSMGNGITKFYLNKVRLLRNTSLGKSSQRTFHIRQIQAP